MEKPTENPSRRKAKAVEAAMAAQASTENELSQGCSLKALEISGHIETPR